MTLRCLFGGHDEPVRERGTWVCPRCGAARPRLTGAETYPERAHAVAKAAAVQAADAAAKRAWLEGQIEKRRLEGTKTEAPTPRIRRVS